MAYCPFVETQRCAGDCYCVSPINPGNKKGDEGTYQGVMWQRCWYGNKAGGYTVEECPFNPMNKNHL